MGEAGAKVNAPRTALAQRSPREPNLGPTADNGSSWARTPEAELGCPPFDGGAQSGQMRSVPTADPQKRAARLGRRLGILAFAIPVAGATAIWTAQILHQVFWPESQLSSGDCRSGVLSLDRALRRARDAAAEEAHGERAALDQFRRSLLPEWQTRTGLERACTGDAVALRALSDIDALRYAEEHAVRYEAVALAKQRRRADAIRRELLGHTASPSKD